MVPDSTKFGCAWKDCAGINVTKPTYLVVCQYDIKFRKDKHTTAPGNPCSKCGENEPKCYKGLCMSKDLCREAKFKYDCACKIECEEDATLNEEECECEKHVGKLNVQAPDKLKDGALYLRRQDAEPTEGETTPDMPEGGDSKNDTYGEGTGDIEVSSSQSPEASRENSETHLLPTVNNILAGLLLWLMHSSLLSKYFEVVQTQEF